jgi:hypothetical protein
VVANPDLLADDGDGSSLVKQYLCLAELVDVCSGVYPFLAIIPLL